MPLNSYTLTTLDFDGRTLRSMGVRTLCDSCANHGPECAYCDTVRFTMVPWQQIAPKSECDSCGTVDTDDDFDPAPDSDCDSVTIGEVTYYPADCPVFVSQDADRPDPYRPAITFRAHLAYVPAEGIWSAWATADGWAVNGQTFHGAGAATAANRWYRETIRTGCCGGL
jgi:hypothetical protein